MGFWVVVFTVMTLYALAILLTRLIGHGDVLPSDSSGDREIDAIRVMFGSVCSSMYSLFGAMSGWSLEKFSPLFEAVPLLQPCFVLFYVYSCWALLAVMTGVVSENMIAIRDQMVMEDEAREEMRKTMITDLLFDLFTKADTDCSGTVSRAEFNAMLKMKDLGKKLAKNTRVRVQDLEELFDWLDHDESGTITIDEFMAGFKWVNEPLRAKSLVRLQDRLVQDLKSLEDTVMKAFTRRFGELSRIVQHPLRRIEVITEQAQNLDASLKPLRKDLAAMLQEQPQAGDLRGVESRLTARFQGVMSNLDDLEQRAIGGHLGRNPDDALGVSAGGSRH